MLRTIIFTFLRTSVLAIPLHSNLSTLLNSSSASIFNFSPSRTSNLSSAGNCFEPRSGRLPTNYHDCEEAASQINPLSLPYPITFSRRPEAQFKLPRSYRSRTCIIYLDMVQDTDEDTVLLLDVWGASMDLAHECVRRNPWGSPTLGGYVSVGPAKLLHVVIFGREDPGAVGIATA